MQTISVKIKLVILSINAEALVVYAPNDLLPSEDIVKDIPLDEQVEKLFLKTLGFHLENNYIEQLYTVSNDKNEITLVYYVLLSQEKSQLQDNMYWREFKKMHKKTADNHIIAYAVQRLQWKIEYTNVVYSLLPEAFTLSELQKTYEAILGQNLDKRNFRKKMLALQFLQLTGMKRVGVARPAQMYAFKNRNPIMIKIFS